MLTIDNHRITLTRGDDTYFDVNITTEDGTEYELAEGDKVVFTVKKRAVDTTELIKIQSQTGKIRLSSDDTENLDFGVYEYDIQLITADENVYTVVPCNKFVVGKEVGW